MPKRIDRQADRRIGRGAAVSRRHFLRAVGVATAGLLVGGCAPEKALEGQVNVAPFTPEVAIATPEAASATPDVPTATTDVPTATPDGATATPDGATATPDTATVTPTSAGVTTPMASATPRAAAVTPAVAGTEPDARLASQVAIARVKSYDRELIRQQVRDVLDGIGGLGDVIRAGDRVAIKVNLTGGTAVKPLPGVSPIDSYVTHPEVVRALGELVRDAGARELFIVEAVYDWNSYKQWGYEEVAEALDARLIDLNDTQPYSDYASTPAGEGAFIYSEFTFNHILEEIDAFISVPKMKCHWSCGVTHSLKNLIGLVPARFYRMDPGHNYRSGFHGTEQEMGTRLPRVIIDLNRARPIDLALIDGIKTTEGGEGPWIGTLTPVEPGVLIAGKDPVAADAVATAAMAFDPMATRSQGPFLRSDNHLNIASELGLGTNSLKEIDVIGASISDVRVPFTPSGR